MNGAQFAFSAWVRTKHPWYRGYPNTAYRACACVVCKKYRYMESFSSTQGPKHEA